MYPHYTKHVLTPGGDSVFTGTLPESLLPAPHPGAPFEALWALHPETYHTIMMHGRPVQTPRWQQAYGADYHYTGRVNKSLPLTPHMLPFLAWAQSAIDARLNGLLFNWYDAEHKHYIGKHRDSTKGMIEGTPIVTISLGETRIFRMRPWKQISTGSKQHVDLPVPHGSVIVIPYDTNLRWTHEVPHFSRFQARRISITLRGFHTVH